MTITFHVPGQPVGKGRPRIGRVAGQARMFTPAKTASYESMVGLAAHQAMGGAPLILGPARAVLRLTLAIPASWSRKKQEQARMGAVLPLTKPDADNVVKAIFDAINGVVWRDDSQVVELTLTKVYGSTPGVYVRIEELK